MKHRTTIRKQQVEFVDATKEHMQLIYKWRNQLFIREVMYNSEHLQWEYHIKWFENNLIDDQVYMKILYYEGMPYGLANFRLTDNQSNLGEWGFYIGVKEAPKGMGMLLGYYMLQFLFEEVMIRKVCAEVIDYNERSLHFHKKVGFTQDGLLRKHILKNGEYCDIYLFSIFKDEWLKMKSELEKMLFTE
ncbi:UDP-4-amino-4,6-dideoxy-N-acetyl-beta-L-altrosamine N-acetyltransferase [Caryophanon latum]|uniref:UDP-4-amino-4, 6-dideoxy-N-acetyl-beta-L-altrosamine N-acetyltransferase n=1 Tax=Caryophanon latum TaxID=33977 RepID=A0A1C0YR22_9BACL|nr:UDP-4-amino-4,6-dideoxy-N-acetyl-beta-L-altrosamine N-acetyltransferase [Caryophanon latum]OCS89628.1 UDP-4-amino-4,6-dideoxy-N-acetyl-beta-L-altrosamine N-acetyltransferase [Caryophanon latum]